MATPSPFRLVVDQNVPRAVAHWLRAVKPEWTVVHTSEIEMASHDDLSIYTYAQDQSAAVLTFDEDFADRRAFHVAEHWGIIRLRVWPTTLEEVQSALSRMIAAVDVAEIKGALVIVDSHKIRVRRGP